MKNRQALEPNRATTILVGKSIVLKNKLKGRNKPGRRQKRKQDNIISAKRPILEAQSREISMAKKPKLSNDSVPRALKRFV